MSNNIKNMFVNNTFRIFLFFIIQGNAAFQEKEEEIRMGNLELAEVQRRLAAVLN